MGAGMKSSKLQTVLATAFVLPWSGPSSGAQSAPTAGNSAPNPAPWFDVTAYGAACDSTMSDTAAIQAALNAASKVSGTVFTPSGKTCVVSTLNLDGFIGVKVIGGFGGNPLSGNVQSTWKFTGSCATAACLSMRSTQAVSFRNIQLSFPSATTGPMVDLSRSPALKTDSGLIRFD